MSVTTHKFALGRTLSTPAALSELIARNIDVTELLTRHVTGDWGDMTDDDKQANNDALIADVNGEYERVFSSYRVGADRLKIWIITEADRSATTVLLPSEY